jgi:hypothetical protein
MTKHLWLGSLLLAACSSGGGTGTDASSSSSFVVFINELQASNQDTVTDELGEPDDWIELFNAGGGPVDLRGFSVADSSGIVQTLPGSVVVPANGFALLWADDSPSQGANHLGFKLSASKGDSLTLKDPTGRTVDQVSFGPATGQVSYARYPDGVGAFAWCAVPTPGASNGAACAQ